MRKIAILFFLSCVTFSGTTFSQWKYLTGYSSAVIAIGGYGDTVFISTSPGLSDSFKVYRSGDYGLTWARVDSSLPVDVASSVQCFASIGSNLFAGMTSYGVRRSTDGGRTWKPTSSFYALGDAYSLATRSDTLFVGYYNVSWSTNLGSTGTQASF